MCGLGFASLAGSEKEFCALNLQMLERSQIESHMPTDTMVTNRCSGPAYADLDRYRMRKCSLLVGNQPYDPSRAFRSSWLMPKLSMVNMLIRKLVGIDAPGHSMSLARDIALVI